MERLARLWRLPQHTSLIGRTQSQHRVKRSLIKRARPPKIGEILVAGSDSAEQDAPDLADGAAEPKFLAMDDDLDHWVDTNIEDTVYQGFGGLEAAIGGTKLRPERE
jgi:hypothetical protein